MFEIRPAGIFVKATRYLEIRLFRKVKSNTNMVNTPYKLPAGLLTIRFYTARITVFALDRYTHTSGASEISRSRRFLASIRALRDSHLFPHL